MSAWLECRQDYELFWRLTPRELGAIIDGANAAKIADFEAGRVLNNDLARLVGWAFHQPRKMPDYKPLRRGASPETSTEADEAKVRAFFIGLATRAK